MSVFKEKQEQDVLIDLRRLGVNAVHLVPKVEEVCLGLID